MDIQLFRTLSEKQRRLCAGQEAIEYGKGGISAIARKYDISKGTVWNGVQDVKAGVVYDPKQGDRKPGCGRKGIREIYPNIREAIEEIIKDSSYGSPETERAWVTMSLVKIAEILDSEYDIKVCPHTVGNILRSMKYSRQQNQKMLQTGKPDPNRDRQFKNIQRERNKFEKLGEPVLSCDAKKKNS
mgnify:CR=1 FL=1